MAASPDFLDTIVGREAVPGDPNVVRVLFHHRDALLLRVADWVDLHLKVGLTVASELHVELVRRANMVGALQLARTYLTGRVKTSAQVKSFLERKEVEEGVIGDVIRHLEQIGVLDDAAYAALFIEQSGERTGRRQLMEKLLRRGVPRDVVQDALVHHLSRDVELTAAIGWAEKYVRRHGRPTDARERLKLMQHLARKGCPSEVVRRAIDVALEGLSTDE
ncbi:RecX family transcriptional regulator [Alicyclobacillus fastidiosus]|uniref:Regulatory protein RecX n=1 Tax=Alicyclobacillus fastidiosus TaxID=392011 RepID=A0ABY6ZC77_9BACL|nr:regulatory protein RecX [Alicyclobacillus fastidiosus]WAH40143.1 RecX family transcriptional regulator [Alicyclobacillus fastidiosus]GMA61485.1 hypothetical protein GCM10025859_19250 [Alicyclobacillus fastidiosus]